MSIFSFLTGNRSGVSAFPQLIKSFIVTLPDWKVIRIPFSWLNESVIIGDAFDAQKKSPVT